MDAAGDGTKGADMKALKALRYLIWLQTEKAYTESLHQAQQRGKGDIKLVKEATTTLFRLRGQQSTPHPSSHEHDSSCRVRVVEKDCLEEAGELVAKGKKVAVLNMANANKPGGGYKSGAGAQEENLHRRSDVARFTEGYFKLYPIPEDGCLLSTEVTVFRGSEAEGYPFLDQPFRVTMIACAAPQKPQLTRDNKYKILAEKNNMETKIQVILDAAIQAGCDVTILSAFGCGAFGNPPEAVAQMFSAALAKSKLKGAVFCIFDDHNAGGRHNPEGNFKPFRKNFPE